MPFTRRGQETAERALRAAQDRNNGRAPSLTGLAAQGVAQREVADMTSLPATGNERDLTTAAGEPVFVVGYSALGGGDVAG